MGVLDISRHCDSELLVSLASLQDVTGPPFKGRVTTNIIVDSVLSSLYRMTFLHDREFLPQSRTVLPLDTHLPACCGTLVLNLAMLVSELLVGVGVGSQAAPVCNH